jgi:small-conductance mechanosensitive channel
VVRFSAFLCLFFSVLILLPPASLKAQDAAGAEGPAGEAPFDGVSYGGSDGSVPDAIADAGSDVIPDAESGEAKSGEAEDGLLGELEGAIEEAAGGGSGGLVGRLGIALGIVVLQILLIWIFWRHVFKFITRRVVEYSGGKIKPFTIKKLRILSVKQIVNLIILGINVIKYLFTAIQLVITVPLVFVLFPGTRDFAATIFGYILTPLKNIVFGTIAYIPNLITIAVIIIVTRYVLRALKFFAVQIEKEKLVIPGFYADWASPSFNILRVLLFAFTVAIIYPYLPGSDSRIFQGVSVLVGIIFSMGSSSAIGNLVAGLVVTYMRPFKIGDRIKINEVTGFVVEKTLMVIRLRTHKNEYVTFPNLMILNSSVVNYHTSSDEDEEGLILNTTITFGYGTPWQTIHEILINAALATSHVLKSPKPFVLQTALDDFYVNYQINCYSRKVDLVPRIYSELFQNIQNGFRAAGLDMTAPHFRVNMPYSPPVLEEEAPVPRRRRTGTRGGDA